MAMSKPAVAQATVKANDVSLKHRRRCIPNIDQHYVTHFYSQKECIHVFMQRLIAPFTAMADKTECVYDSGECWTKTHCLKFEGTFESNQNAGIDR